MSLPALRPRVYQRPHPPIWRSVVTPASFAECGRLGVPIMTSRIPLGALRDRFTLYEDGLIAGGHSQETRERLLRDVAVWRHVYLAQSQAQAEDELSAALLQTRRHMLHARAAHNPRTIASIPPCSIRSMTRGCRKTRRSASRWTRRSAAPATASRSRWRRSATSASTMCSAR